MNSARTTDYLPGKRRMLLETELHGRTLTTYVRHSRDLRRYFRDNYFSLRYSDEIHAGEGLLAIPGLALLLPLIWLTGANVRLPYLDRTFAVAAGQLQQRFSNLYPKIPFGTELEIDNLVDSPPNPEGTASMFSGGMDATYTVFANRQLNPHLVQVFGTEFPCTEAGFMEALKQKTSSFAAQHGFGCSFVETDFRSCVDERALYHTFSRRSGRLNCTLWNGMGFALGFVGIAAPLSAGRFNHLLLAAWAPQEFIDTHPDYTTASSPSTDNRIAWSNLRVEHHGCLHRHEKVSAMKEWLEGEQLRVCWSFDDPSQVDGMMNCSHCEKCARTILALALAGIDPAQCGFTIDPANIAVMRRRLEKREMPDSYLALWWEPMQKQIPAELEGEWFGLREFLAWFRDFDLLAGREVTPSPLSMASLYTRFPYPLALAIRSLIYRVLDEPHWMNEVHKLPPE